MCSDSSHKVSNHMSPGQAGSTCSHLRFPPTFTCHLIQQLGDVFPRTTCQTASYLPTCRLLCAFMLRRSACSTCGGHHNAPKGRNCREPRCGECNLWGHESRDCPLQQCRFCQWYGHTEADCPGYCRWVGWWGSCAVGVGCWLVGWWGSPVLFLGYRNCYCSDMVSLLARRLH